LETEVWDVTEGVRTICGFAMALPIYGLFIFFSVKITGIEDRAYGKSAKAALLAFTPVIIFVFLNGYFHPLVAYILAILLFMFFSVKIIEIEYRAYGRFAKAAVLAFIPLIIVLILIGTTYFHPLAASILTSFILPFVIKRVFQTTYVLACLASVIVLCSQIVILIAISVAGFGGTRISQLS
jgi:hypothetical protein